MVSVSVKFASAAVILLAGTVMLNQRAVAANMVATYASVGSITSVPYGWVDFCKRYKGECNGSDLPAMDTNLTPQSMKIIDKVNRWVNSNITPVSDQDHWGIVDQWDYPLDGKGDCEDYVLLKRKMLKDEGFPVQSLLMTVVRDSHNDGHAVLTVKTNHGEYALDNMSNEVKPWNATGYRYVKRQSQENQNVWVNIGEPTPPPVTVSRGGAY